MQRMLHRALLSCNSDTCISLIKQCLHLKSLKSVHASLLKSNLHLNIFFSTNLITQYLSLRDIATAHTIFSASKFSIKTDAFLWNVMIRGFTDNAHFQSSLSLYTEMRSLGILPNNFTFPFAIKACACVSDLGYGVRIHCDVVLLGYEFDVFAGNSLIHMYGKCGRFDVARQVFDRMTERNSVSWSSMIGAYAQNCRYKDGVSLFLRMLMEKIKPNRGTILNVMECVFTENDANDVIRVVMENGLDFDGSVQSAAMGMYARCGRIDISRKIFDEIPSKDLLCWTSMIELYAKGGLSVQALELYRNMNLQGHVPDTVTILSVIRACSFSPYFQEARMIHGLITVRNMFVNQVVIVTALIDLYVKCGTIIYARKVFDKMDNHNLITWSTMISGYATHGYGREALSLFNQMKMSEKPDHITFVSLLSACSHCGLVSEGWECFHSMTRDYELMPRTEHYVCMVDLLGRAGKLSEAYDFIEKMPINPDAGVWGALLGACRIHSNLEIAVKAAKSLLDLDSENPGRYVLLSNIYTSSGKIKEADQIRDLMVQRGVRKIVGHANIS